MSQDLSTTLYPEATGRVDVVFSQPTTVMRWTEGTTECRHIEALFLLVDDSRDAHIKQLLDVFPHLKDKNRVVRFANVKLDQHYPENFSRYIDSRDSSRTRPRFGQLYRVETRFTNIGNSSVKFQHRFLTVPASQAKRDFNNRHEDDQYSLLEEGEEPERIFASAEGATSRQVVFQNPALAAPPVIDFLKETAPERRPAGSVRPQNAFRVQIHLRKSDEDELGHVTNSRYVSLIHDVLTFGLRTGYYANGVGAAKTAADLPVIPSHTLATVENVAIPAGSSFYKRGTIFELYVGYERELKVQPGVYVWSWVEPEKIHDEFDVVRFEICSIDEKGQEQVLSLSRAVIKEDTQQRSLL
ncbi:hypothetical protein BGZ58_008245 [Dissophora ornata]|nr:hypothetical protein BGZ58_008245 [Dissophora ornata]